MAVVVGVGGSGAEVFLDKSWRDLGKWSVPNVGHKFPIYITFIGAGLGCMATGTKIEITITGLGKRHIGIDAGAVAIRNLLPPQVSGLVGGSPIFVSASAVAPATGLKFILPRCGDFVFPYSHTYNIILEQEKVKPRFKKFFKNYPLTKQKSCFIFYIKGKNADPKGGAI